MENKKFITNIISNVLFMFLFFSLILYIGHVIISYTPKNKIILIGNNNNIVNSEHNENQSGNKKRHRNINMKVLPDFITENEAKYLIRLANKRLKKSRIIDDNTNDNTASDVRTSQSAFFKKSEYKLLKNIEQRAAKLMKVDYVQIEPVQIVKYEPGEKYDNHYDWFKHPEKTRDGKGQRLQTMFVYLNDGYEGGSTSFPKIKVRYFGKKGEALIWDNIKNGKPDKNSLHRGDVIESGTKYGMNIWIREK